MKILVPIDFSQSSKIGVEYATKVAESLNSEIIFVHTYSGGYQYAGYGAIAYPVPDNFSSYQDLYKEKMLEFLENFPRLATIKYKSIVTSGRTSDIIFQLATEEKVNLVIMGTEGAGEVEGYLAGTTSEKISMDVPCPVLVVPEDLETFGLKRICLALDSDNLRPDRELSILANLLMAFNASLFIFHSSKSKDENINEQEVKDYYKQFFNLENISVHLFSDGKTEENITNFLKENIIDVLALLYREHDFIEKLTELGLRRKMIFKSEAPVLILK
ncbi:universal stress protein [Leeuwenhoekiella palythoae]|uniref:Universal stress protein UspA-like protein n=1 Tax=Galbibacter orientalis DSM 19592 TaxID=926559 RepID=I3C8F0_9FLAO|nr:MULTISPECIES: universal stress protein [Flavobacteriaceae]EIJ39893.1 universal stress protein UspA-like protein [Galbibacter orientalis DSM 19592]UBZ09319.1 universal stress protein [Leeuwenhoekiella palythoae]